MRHDDERPQDLDRLPRERIPSRTLEERTVAALRERGVLQPRRGVSPWRAGLAVAAGLALFVGGVLIGEWRAGSPARGDDGPPSARVRAAGSAYVAALGDLARSGEPASAENVEARSAAVEALHQAAGEVMLLSPGDPVAEGILVAFDEVDARGRTDEERVRRIVWF